MKYMIMLLLSISLYAENCNRYDYKINSNITKASKRAEYQDGVTYANLALVYAKLKEICLIKNQIRPKNLGHDRSFGE